MHLRVLGQLHLPTKLNVSMPKKLLWIKSQRWSPRPSGSNRNRNGNRSRYWSALWPFSGRKILSETFPNILKIMVAHSNIGPVIALSLSVIAFKDMMDTEGLVLSALVLSRFPALAARLVTALKRLPLEKQLAVAQTGTNWDETDYGKSKDWSGAKTRYQFCPHLWVPFRWYGDRM